MAPGNSKHTHVVAYVPGTKGAPSFTKLYQYPSFSDNQVLANKSFFQADSVDFKWNSIGSTVLLLTQSEVDKTGGSYYGKQQLRYMSIKCDTGMVSLAREGPIYSVEWFCGNLFATVMYTRVIKHLIDRVFMINIPVADIWLKDLGVGSVSCERTG